MPRSLTLRILAGLAALLLVLVLSLGLALSWLWQGDDALATVLARVPGLQLSGVHGSIGSGRVVIDQASWQRGGTKITSDQLVLGGLAVGWRRLSIQQLSIQRITVTTTPGGGPLAAPHDLLLPIDVEVGALRVGTLQIDALPAVRSLTARVSLSSAAHRVDDLAFDIDQAHLQGRFSVAATAPLTWKSALAASGTGARPWTAEANAGGVLDKISITLNLMGQPLPGKTAPAASAQATVTPFAAWPLAALTLATRQLDLSALVAGWPETALDASAQVQSSGLAQPARASVKISNARPGRIDEDRLPLQSLTVELQGEPRQPDKLALNDLALQFADSRGLTGRASGRGQWSGDAAELVLQLDAVQPQRIDARAAALSVAGPVTLRASQLRTQPNVELTAQLVGRTLDGRGTPVNLALEAAGNADALRLTKTEASSGAAKASASGQALREAAGWRIALKAQLERFDPLPWWRGAERSAWRQGPHRLSGKASFEGLRRSLGAGLAALEGTLNADLNDSLIAGVPSAGHLQWQGQGLAGGSVSGTVEAWLDAGGNRFSASGRIGGPNEGAADRWQLRAQAPALAGLAPLGRLAAQWSPGLANWWPQAGRVEADAQLQGRWPSLSSQGQARIEGWRSGAALLRRGTLAWRAAPGVDAPLGLTLDAQGLRLGTEQIDRLQAQIDGTLGAHRLTISADSPQKPPAWSEAVLGPAGNGTRLEGRAQGTWQPRAGGGGSWSISGLTLDGGARDAQGRSRSWLDARDLAGQLVLDAQGVLQSLTLAPGRVQLLSAGLRWRDAQWHADGLLVLAAELETIDVASLLKRAQPDIGWGGDLTLGGRIDIRSAAKVDAEIVLERGGGDLTITDDLGEVIPLGLTDLRLALTVHDGLWQFAQGLAGRTLGEMAGAQVLRTSADRRWPGPDATLQGVLQARVANLGVWGTWVPPGWRLAGSLTTSAEIGGRLGAPELRGQMVGSGLGVRNLLQGVNLSDGDLAITLRGERAEIERFVFKGGDGRLTLTGGATLGERPNAALHVMADHFRLLGRIDRRIVASGDADMALNAETLEFDGRFTIDEGLVDVSHADAPALDGDVRVRPRAAPAVASAAAASAPAAAQAIASAASAAASAPASALPAPLRNAQVAVTIALGEKLQLRGRGLDTALRGELRVASTAGRLTLNGAVRTEGGTYAAYGQKLEIVRGEVVFNGVVDNPRIDVLATRPNLDVIVGVAVTGFAQSPRIRLTSTPEMADFDKLSWLVLGRGPDGLGRTDTALLQRAAVALLAGEGRAPTDALLSQLGLTDFSLRQTEGDVRETIVSLGRQLSNRWYVGYERSVNATTGTWQLIYRIAQRFTLRAQSGSENALDLIWSWRW